MTSVRIFNADCRDVLASMEPESIDCVIADPPYGETSLQWDRWVDGWPTLVRRVLKPTGSMWCFGSQRMFWRHREEFHGWNLSQDVVWRKHNGSGFHVDRFRRIHELALHFWRDDVAWSRVYKEPQFTHDATRRTVRRKTKPAHWNGCGASTYISEDGGPRLMCSVIDARSEHHRAEHPTQKPIEIVEPLVRYACPPGGGLLDPFAGAGTTGVVAQQLGLSCTLIESDPHYAEIARIRVAGGVLFAAAGQRHESAS
jgi:site-specific DNA-methyltransferase (adenine-specific)